jgi:hypothetical protein
LTWLENYQKAEAEIPGFDLVRCPNNALELPIAAKILVKGMVGGWFTGRKLDDYFPLGGLTRMVGGHNLVRTDVMRLEKRLDAVDLELKQQTEILVMIGKQSVRLDRAGAALGSNACLPKPPPSRPPEEDPNEYAP